MGAAPREGRQEAGDECPTRLQERGNVQTARSAGEGTSRGAAERDRPPPAHRLASAFQWVKLGCRRVGDREARGDPLGTCWRFVSRLPLVGPLCGALSRAEDTELRSPASQSSGGCCLLSGRLFDGPGSTGGASAGCCLHVPKKSIAPGYAGCMPLPWISRRRRDRSVEKATTMTMHGGLCRVLAAPPAVFVATSVNGGLRTCVTTRSQMCLWTRCYRVATMGVHPQRSTRVATFRAQLRAAVLGSGVSKGLPSDIARALARRTTVVTSLLLADRVVRGGVMAPHKCEVRPINKRIAKRICKRIDTHVWTPGEAAISTNLAQGMTAPTTRGARRRLPQAIARSRAENSGMAAPVGQSKHSPKGIRTIPGSRASEAPTTPRSHVSRNGRCAARRNGHGNGPTQERRETR